MQAAGLVNDHTTDCFRHPSNGKSRSSRKKTTNKVTSSLPQPGRSHQSKGDKANKKNPLNIRLKRINEAPSTEDGFRVLVDRLWPRGLAKEAAALDLWLRDVAPSTALRKWFNHEASRWMEFTHRYAAELDQQPETVGKIRRLLRKGKLTFLFSAKDQKLNNAVALKAYLEMSE
jgi:uncharacterized protein YeaO (DUF488 family)